MTDEDFTTIVSRLDAQGMEGRPAMRELLKDPKQMSRLIALAVRGALRLKRTDGPNRKTFLPDTFPDEIAKERAIAHWRKMRRPDLEATLDDQCAKFRDHFADLKTTSWALKWATWYRNAPDFVRPPQGASLFVIPPTFKNTNREGWINRLRIFYGADKELAVGTWHPTWGPTPKEPGCRCPDEVKEEFLSPQQRLAL